MIKQIAPGWRVSDETPDGQRVYERAFSVSTGADDWCGLDEVLPDVLKAVRTERGHSQEFVARMLGISLATVNRWERGRSVPRGLYRGIVERYLAGE